jgi:hypothetical protein
MIGNPRHDKQEVAQPIEIFDNCGINRAVAAEGDHASLGASADGACQVEGSRSGGTAGQE